MVDEGHKSHYNVQVKQICRFQLDHTAPKFFYTNFSKVGLWNSRLFLFCQMSFPKLISINCWDWRGLKLKGTYRTDGEVDFTFIEWESCGGIFNNMLVIQSPCLDVRLFLSRQQALIISSFVCLNPFNYFLWQTKQKINNRVVTDFDALLFVRAQYPLVSFAFCSISKGKHNYWIIENRCPIWDPIFNWNSCSLTGSRFEIVTFGYTHIYKHCFFFFFNPKKKDNTLQNAIKTTPKFLFL